ncbi:EF-hand calcium-binding domain-containing protein 14-like isoform X2 [Acipenser ruthenus]|uniref:EF-hand calcium-binding domain-containing protein 14-like isoform X2 n=1 Tax=Acipenser ruthenus TaxID=7906 RepID=UPI00274219CA|nr:EF-hand calcium-binding domain-containing protein 14-like isoform X2 [Acipenser ruthenus]
MKKRKELDALIGLGGDSKRKKTKKGSGHRLLRTEPPDSDSESSSDEGDVFNTLGSSGFKGGYTQCCKVCYPLCVFIVLVACVVACSGLIWMQIALKEDLDAMKETIRTMESSQKISSHEISKLSEDLLEKQKLLENMERGSKGLNKIWTNMTEIHEQITLIDSAVSHLQANIKSASDLINLPTTVEELQKSVATIGSTLTSVQHDVETMQTSLDRKIVDSIRKNENEKQDETNKESDQSSASSAVPASSNCTPCVIFKQDSENDDHQVTELREKLLLINALTSKPGSEQLYEDSVHGDPESDHLSQENSKKTESKKIPIISEHSPKTNSEDFPKNPDNGKLERDTVKNSGNGEITKSEDLPANSDSAKQENEDTPKNSDNSKDLPRDNNKRPENMKSENLSKNFDLSKQESEDLPANSDNGGLRLYSTSKPTRFPRYISHAASRQSIKDLED